MDKKKYGREYYIEKLKRFRLLDDDFMTEVFRDNIPAVELLLWIVLGKEDIKVSSCETQRVMSGRGYRAIRMDVHAKDSAGRESDIEIQREDRGAGAKRVIRTYTRRCDQDPNEQFGDGNYVIYVNGENKNDDEPILKETKGGQDRMCKIMEDMRREAAEEAVEAKSKEIAFKLHDEDGFSFEKIALTISESLSTVQRWFAEQPY